MKTVRKRTVLMVVITFLLLSTIYAVSVRNTLRRSEQDQREHTEFNASVYASEILIDFERGITITRALEQVIVDSGGQINHFDTVAANLMEDYVGSIQIAPGGVVSNIYPMEGNEAGLLDLLHDEKRGPVVRYGMEHNVITVQGPFELKQGGVGIAVRDPVFLTDEDGNPTFWGLTIAIIKVPDIFSDTLDSLNAFGYDYNLSATVSPLTDERKVVAASREVLEDPAEVSFPVGECTWVLQVSPREGWEHGGHQNFHLVMGAAFVLLVTLLLGMLSMVSHQRRQLHTMVETDQLTGILNRTGFVRRVEGFFERPAGPATEAMLDIDDFKLVNDLYGHACGDLALQSLARDLTAVFEGRGYVARTGGDEFGIFLPGLDAEQAEPLFRRLSEMDHGFDAPQGEHISYTISIGFADYPAQAANRGELIRSVDSALYHVKLNGKQGCQRFAPGMVKQSRQQIGFSQKELASLIPGSGFICHAEDTRILYINEELLALLECRDLNQFQDYSKGMFQNIIHPSDLERVLCERNEKLERVPEGTPICCRFRVVTRTGRVYPMIAEAKFHHHALYGDLFFGISIQTDQG